MSLNDLQSLLPQLILALGGTVVLMLGAWVQNRRLWLLVGMALALAAAPAFAAGQVVMDE